MTTKATFEVKNFESPDERRDMDHLVLEVVNLPGATIARAVFQPGWRWSTDVGRVVGTRSCQVPHLGHIVSGHFHVRMDDGRDHDLGPGDAHLVAPGHDAWVVGDEPCVAIDFTPMAGALAGHVGRCPCGVEFRVATDDQLDHLVVAIQEHASGSHGHQLTHAQVLAEVSGA
ncbi:MAG: cupin domain-containing protein [Acidimicrobiales bacterium]